MTLDEINRLMSLEVARMAPLAWLRSDDRRLLVPAVVYAESGGAVEPVYDRVQGPTGLWEARSRVELVPWPSMTPFQTAGIQAWVLARCMTVDRDEWQRMFGTLEDYPGGGQWMPLSLQGQPLPIHVTHEPTAQDAWDAITVMKASKTVDAAEWMRRHEKRLATLRDDNAYRLRHTVAAFGRILNDPGKRNAAISFPAAGRG